jgi:hypothetical protein
LGASGWFERWPACGLGALSRRVLARVTCPRARCTYGEWWAWSIRRRRAAGRREVLPAVAVGARRRVPRVSDGSASLAPGSDTVLPVALVLVVARVPMVPVPVKAALRRRPAGRAPAGASAPGPKALGAAPESRRARGPLCGPP